MKSTIFKSTRRYMVLGTLFFAAAGVTLTADEVTARSKDDSSGGSKAEVTVPSVFQAPQDAPLPTSRKNVHFTPMDENTSCTVIFLVNTNKEARTVKLVTRRPDGTALINTQFIIPGKNTVRIASDPVVSISATWQDVILVNFTTSSAWGKLVLPKGVFAEGYVAWNNGSTYDPLQIVPTLPLRFWRQ